MQRIIVLLQALRFLLHYQCWTFTGKLLGCPVVTLCHGDPAALDFQAQPLHILQQIIDGVDLRVSQHITLGLGLGTCRVRQPHHQGESSNITLAGSVLVAMSKR